MEDKILAKVKKQLAKDYNCSVKDFENKDNIINKQINVDKQEEYVEVEIIYEVIEKIGIEEKIIL